MPRFENDYDSGYFYPDRSPQNRDYLSRSEARARADLDRYGSYRGTPYGDYDRGRGPFESDRYARYADSGWHRFGPYEKSRWETDYGDPFGDRQQRTPMRVIRGPARAQRGPWESSYGGDYTASRYPLGYRPYSARAGYDRIYDPRSYPGYGQGGW